MLFSERLGYKPAKLDLPREDISNPLRNKLWSCIYILLRDSYKTTEYVRPGYTFPVYCTSFRLLTEEFWLCFMRQPIDAVPTDPDTALERIRSTFLASKFPEFYDLLEFLAEFCTEEDTRHSFYEVCNRFFEQEKAAWRFVGGKLTLIIGQSEIDEVNQAVNPSSSISVAKHISRAIELYSDRSAPDYRNSIKESISVVEAAAKQITGDERATLNDALKKLEKNGQLHSALKNGFSNLYGWTNDEGGIRHAQLDERNLTEADARFMLVSCSAFSNYLLDNSR